MSLGNLKLNRITTGSKVKMIQSDDEVHNLQINNPLGLLPNRFKTLDSSGNWIGNIFKSSQFIKEDTFIPVGADSVRGPEKSPWLTILQCGSSSFNLNAETLNGNSWEGKIGEFTLEQLSVALYNPDLLGTPATNFEATENAWAFLSGLPFNFVAEQPMNDNYYNYDKGELYAHSFKTKNMYDYDYNVSGSFTQINATDTVGVLKDTRQYKNVRNGGSDIWLSYKVGRSLSGTIYEPITEERIEDTGTPIIPVIEYENKNTGVYAYEMAERFKGSIVLQTGGLHKSNLFSLKIVDSKLNTHIEDEKLRSYIQSGINQVIGELMKKITPANTQLFNIFWEGE
jgi:hypothetical protein